ncbi:MAG TPA: universal stress protein [Hyphomicrobiaceae bacterium]
MAYKTILMHLNHDRRAKQLLGAGVQLARAFDAHLIGLHVFPAYRLNPPVPLPIGQDILGRIVAQIEEEANRIKSQFDDATSLQTFVSEWRSLRCERTDPAEVVMRHGYAADLLIASQSDPNWEMTSVLDFPDRLAIESGRPVLVIPDGYVFSEPPKSIIVAWKDRREAARAAFDALPLLKVAQTVEVLTVEEEEHREGGPEDIEIATALDRHGVKVSVTTMPASRTPASEEILNRAAQNSQLLVMGAYGHSRFREFAFGGVTRHILKNMTVPVLFSH